MPVGRSSTGRRCSHVLRDPGSQSPPARRSHDPGHVHGFHVPAVLPLHGLLRRRSQSHSVRKTAIVGYASTAVLLLAVLLFPPEVYTHQV